MGTYLPNDVSPELLRGRLGMWIKSWIDSFLSLKRCTEEIFANQVARCGLKKGLLSYRTLLNIWRSRLQNLLLHKTCNLASQNVIKAVLLGTLSVQLKPCFKICIWINNNIIFAKRFFLQKWPNWPPNQHRHTKTNYISTYRLSPSIWAEWK